MYVQMQYNSIIFLSRRRRNLADIIRVFKGTRR